MDIGRLEQTVWVNYADDEAYCLKFITDDMIRTAIGRDTDNFVRYITEKTPKPSEGGETDSFVTGLLSAVFATDFQVKIACLACVDWRGINSDGKPLECTDENKRLVFEKFSNRLVFVFRECRDEKHFVGNMEEDAKN